MAQEKKTTDQASPDLTLKAEEKTNDSPKTRVNWEGREVKMNQAEEREKNYTEQYAPHLLAQEEQKHVREQLYLFFREGFSEDFLTSVFAPDPGMEDVSLDLLRCLALLGGEDLASSFFNRAFSLSEAKDRLADLAAREKYRQFDEIEKLAVETEKMRERFDTQMKFLEKEHDNARKYAEELISREREMAKEQRQTLTEKNDAEKAQLISVAEQIKNELESERVQSGEKLEKAQKEADFYKAETEREKETVKQLQKDLTLLRSRMENPSAEGESTDSCDGRPGMSFGRRKANTKREAVKRREFIAAVLANPEYTEEQLIVICDAVRNQLSQRELEQMCKPALSPVNMRILEQFFMKPEMEIFPEKEEEK